MTPELSLVVSTLGRSRELVRLFESLEAQTFSSFEVVVVDQNTDERIGELLQERPWSFPIRQVRTPGQRGLSRGRNVGWQASEGRFVCFPDDDCWYPATFLQTARDLLERTRADVLTGRAVDLHGKSINGRFALSAQRVRRDTVWTTQIEWVAFFRRSVLADLGGYDEDIGVGAATPWQACEGQDLVLRALQLGVLCRYEPTLFGHHEEIEQTAPDRGSALKARGYARGLGHVLRKHRFGPLRRSYWVLRPLGGLILSSAGSRGRRRYFWSVVMGRLEGAFGRSFGRQPLGGLAERPEQLAGR